MNIKTVFVMNPKDDTKKWHKLNIEERESKPINYSFILEPPKEKSKMLQYIENNMSEIKYVCLGFKNTKEGGV
jgi:hypothetical protein